MPTWGHPTDDDSQRLGKGQEMPESIENTEKVDATQGATAENKPERTFTQSEMEAIIGERLKRERAKYANYDELAQKAKAFDEAEEASKSELQKAVEERDALKARIEKLETERERADAVAKAAAEYNVDPILLSRMSGDVSENAAYLKETMANAQKYKHVHDGGEVPVPPITRESIEAIEDPVERVRMRAQHQDLY